MDTIDRAFTTASMDDDNFSLPIKVALELGKRIMSKYYNLTDKSEIYRVSIGTLFLFIALLCLTHFIVLHPGLKTQYFKDNKWPQNWQDNVIAITWKIFDEEYKVHCPRSGPVQVRALFTDREPEPQGLVHLTWTWTRSTSDRVRKVRSRSEPGPYIHL